jgi:hypothetical protein
MAGGQVTETQEQETGGDNSVLLVRRSVAPGHPHVIWNQLFAEARKLLREGIKSETIAEALKIWNKKPGAGPGTLPWIVSDVLRGQSADNHDEQMDKLRDWESKLKEELAAD